MFCFNYLQSVISLGEHNPCLAGHLLHITYFPSSQEAINTRSEETLQAASRGLPTNQEDEGGEFIPSEGEGDSPAHQSFKEALFGWSQILEDSCESLPFTEKRRQELTVSVIYFYLFQHFHLMLFCLNF